MYYRKECPLVDDGKERCSGCDRYNMDCEDYRTFLIEEVYPPIKGNGRSSEPKVRIK